MNFFIIKISIFSLLGLNISLANEINHLFINSDITYDTSKSLIKARYKASQYNKSMDGHKISTKNYNILVKNIDNSNRTIMEESLDDEGETKGKYLRVVIKNEKIESRTECKATYDWGYWPFVENYETNTYSCETITPKFCKKLLSQDFVSKLNQCSSLISNVDTFYADLNKDNDFTKKRDLNLSFIKKKFKARHPNSSLLDDTSDNLFETIENNHLTNEKNWKNTFKTTSYLNKVAKQAALCMHLEPYFLPENNGSKSLKVIPKATKE